MKAGVALVGGIKYQTCGRGFNHGFGNPAPGLGSAPIVERRANGLLVFANIYRSKQTQLRILRTVKPAVKSVGLIARDRSDVLQPFFERVLVTRIAFGVGVAIAAPGIVSPS